VEVRSTSLGRVVAIASAIVILALGVLPSVALDLAQSAGVLLAPAIGG